MYPLSIRMLTLLAGLLTLRIAIAASLPKLRLKGRAFYLSLALTLLLPFSGYVVAVIRNSTGAWFERTRSGMRALLLSFFIFLLILFESLVVAVLTLSVLYPHQQFSLDFEGYLIYVLTLFISLLTYPSLILSSIILGSEGMKIPWWMGRERYPLRDLVYTTAAIVLMVMLASAYSVMTHKFFPFPVQQKEILPGDFLTFIIMLVPVSVLAPVGEEIYFRGLILEELSKHWGTLPSALITSLYFALVHGNPLGFILLFALGLILAGLKISTRWIVPTIIAHSAYNTAVLTMAYMGF